MKPQEGTAPIQELLRWEKSNYIPSGSTSHFSLEIKTNSKHMALPHWGESSLFAVFGSTPCCLHMASSNEIIQTRCWNEKPGELYYHISHQCFNITYKQTVKCLWCPTRGYFQQVDKEFICGRLFQAKWNENEFKLLWYNWVWFLEGPLSAVLGLFPW